MTEMAGIEKPLTGVPIPEGYEVHVGDRFRFRDGSHPEFDRAPGAWVTVLPRDQFATHVTVSWQWPVGWTASDGSEARGSGGDFRADLDAELHPETYARHLERTAAKAG